MRLRYERCWFICIKKWFEKASNRPLNKRRESKSTYCLFYVKFKELIYLTRNKI